MHAIAPISVLLLAAVWSSPALAATPSSAILAPLSDGDTKAVYAGCNCSLDTAKGSFVMFGQGKMVMRYQGKRVICAVAPAQEAAIHRGKGIIKCGGLTLTFTVKPQAPADDTDAKAVLVVSDGKRSQKISGGLGCEC